MKKPRIVILGGGFAGLLTAIKLAKKKTPAEIILIDYDNEHLYTPWLYKIPTDIHENGYQSLRSCSFQFKELIKPFPSIRFRQAKVKTILEEENLVILEDGHTVKFDYLLISLGSSTNFFGLKEMSEKAFRLSNPDSVEKVYQAFDDLLDQAKNHKKDKHLVIVGGGATGIEITLELAEIRKKKNISHLSITLIDSSDSLLKRFDPICAKIASRRFKKLDINLINNSVVTGLKGEDIQVKNKNKEFLVHADLIMWAGGVAPNPVIKKLNYAKDDSGRLLVDKYLRLKGKSNIFIAGDCASFQDKNKNSPVPPTAWAAVEQSDIVAHNIKSSILKKGLISYNPPKYYPGVIALGGRHAAGSAYGFSFHGLPAWILKELIHLHYFLKIMPFSNALKTYRRKQFICKLN